MEWQLDATPPQVLCSGRDRQHQGAVATIQLPVYAGCRWPTVALLSSVLCFSCYLRITACLLTIAAGGLFLQEVVVEDVLIDATQAKYEGRFSGIIVDLFIEGQLLPQLTEVMGPWAYLHRLHTSRHADVIMLV